MKLAAFIEQVREAGGVVTLDGEGAVRCLGNPEVMTPEVRAAVERHGEAIRRFIEKERAATLASTTTSSHGWCERCGRVVWVGTGAERLPDGELVCGDCLAPWDIEAGSAPVDDVGEGEGRGDRYPPTGMVPSVGDAGRRSRARPAAASRAARIIAPGMSGMSGMPGINVRVGCPERR